MMKFNLKVILLGGLAMYVTQFIVSMASGPIIHQAILDELYRANAAFWRPELNQDPPDMAALMPRWITTGVLGAFIMAGIYDHIRGALDGSGLVKGMKFGVISFCSLPPCPPVGPESLTCRTKSGCGGISRGW